MDMEVHVEEEEEVVSLPRSRGGRPRKGKEDEVEDVDVTAGAGDEEEEEEEKGEEKGGEGWVGAVVHGMGEGGHPDKHEEDEVIIMQGELEKTDSWVVSGVRGFSEDEVEGQEEVLTDSTAVEEYTLDTAEVHKSLDEQARYGSSFESLKYDLSLENGAEVEVTPGLLHSNIEGITIHKHLNDVVGMGGEAVILKEDDKEENLEDEYDVESVLEKQNTHDLFCPNCKSCITKRVILFRKRRKVRNLQYRIKVDKIEEGATSASNSKPAVAADDRTVLPGTTTDINEDWISVASEEIANREGEINEDGEVFRCLSCFKFFICTGDGPNLGWNVGGKKLDKDVQALPQELPPAIVDSSSAPGKHLTKDIENQSLQSAKTLQDAVKKTKDKLTVVVEGAETAAPQTPTIPEATQVTETGQAREYEIMKSLVYGGLIESITSLGIVSSAAGGGASTLNTLALALANLFGGLFVIAHNLKELKKEQPSTITTGETPDRYAELVGNRRHFLLHATIVILSFIVFGAVAPVTYAFSFRKSNSRDYKLAVVAAASLSCILLLSIVKAYVRRPPKSYLKTISYYIVMGVTASGISFLVGELFDYLLQKLGWFSSTSSFSGPLSITVPAEYGFASY